jgi:hypothetical protein
MDARLPLRERLRVTGRSGRVAGWLVIASVALMAAVRVTVCLPWNFLVYGPILGGLDLQVWRLLEQSPISPLTRQRLVDFVLAVRLAEVVLAVVIMLRLLAIAGRLIARSGSARRSWVPWDWPLLFTLLFVAGTVQVAYLEPWRGWFAVAVVVTAVGSPFALGALLYARYLLPRIPVSTVDEIDHTNEHGGRHDVDK